MPSLWTDSICCATPTSIAFADSLQMLTDRLVFDDFDVPDEHCDIIVYDNFNK